MELDYEAIIHHALVMAPDAFGLDEDASERGRLLAWTAYGFLAWLGDRAEDRLAAAPPSARQQHR